MNIVPFIYGRTKFEDHRFLAQPLDDFCSSQTFDWFKDFVRQVINTDHFGEIAIPRWSLAKKDGYLLWGCGLYLKMINNEFTFDVGARPVRCFIGFLTKESEQIENLPYGNNFLLYFFNIFIIPKWEEGKNIPNKVSEFIMPELNGQDISKDASFLVELNRNPNKLKLFPIDENDSINLFAAALTLNEISVVTGLNYKRHSLAAGFLNSSVFEVKEECVVDFTDKSKLSDYKSVSHPKSTLRNENVDAESSNSNMKQKHSLFDRAKMSIKPSSNVNKRPSSSDDDFNLEQRGKNTPNFNHDYFGNQSSDKDEKIFKVENKSTVPFGFKYEKSIDEKPILEISNIDKLIENINSKISIASSQANQQFEKEIISILDDIVKIISQIPK